MYRVLGLFLLMLTVCTCAAQQKPRPRVVQKVADPTMVVNDRGALLEVLPTQRATPSISKTGKRVVYQVATRDASAAISPKQLGVVFNHAMQVQGYITGEIVFKFKRDSQPPSSFGTGSYPGFAKLTNPNVFLVVARSPAEFVSTVKRLQERTDLEWIEPIVVYGPLQPSTVTP